MEEMHHLARERIGMASEKMKTRYNARATRHDFHEGDNVWLWNPNRRKGLSLKLQNNWGGPYTVLKRLNDVVVRIKKSPHPKPKNYGRLLRLTPGIIGRPQVVSFPSRRIESSKQLLVGLQVDTLEAFPLT
ncbi:kinectin [Trichonephila clavipes]|nr:kinectin [Trichonephila clavipes]